MKNKLKKQNKIWIAFIIVMAVFSSLGVSLAYSMDVEAIGIVTEDQANSPWEKLVRATQLEIVTEALYNCLNDVDHKLFDYRNKKAIWLGNDTINVGAWLEKEATSKADDGKIYCSEKNDGSEDKTKTARDEGLLVTASLLYVNKNDPHYIACDIKKLNQNLLYYNTDCDRGYSGSDQYKTSVLSSFTGPLEALYKRSIESTKKPSGGNYAKETFSAVIGGPDNEVKVKGDSPKIYATAFLEAQARGCFADLQIEETDASTRRTLYIGHGTGSDGQTEYKAIEKWFDENKKGITDKKISAFGKDGDNKKSCENLLDIMDANGKDTAKFLNENLKEQRQQATDKQKKDSAQAAFDKAVTQENKNQTSILCLDAKDKENKDFPDQVIAATKKGISVHTFASITYKYQFHNQPDISLDDFYLDITEKTASDDFFAGKGTVNYKNITEKAKASCQAKFKSAACSLQAEEPTFYTCCVRGDQKDTKLKDLKNSNQCLGVVAEAVEPVDVPIDDSGLNGVSASTGADAEPTCENIGAGALGWIVCPTTEALADGVDGIYSSLKGLLNINVKFIDTSSKSYKIWGTFRNYANIAMVIFILVVVFSQLTGVGIDNYGIKKMLPRIIVAAILINLSYFVCQICVDLSNILGNSLNLLITSAVGGKSAAPIQFRDILADGIALLGGGATLFLTSGAVIGGGFWAFILPLLIGLLVAIVAVLVFFIMLSARELIVVVCVIVSPLAIVCYILPGTQKLFKKWVDIFKTMLIIYPVCSALYGVGFIIKAITVPSGAKVDFWQLLLGSLATVLPYLAAPTLVKSALNGLGSLGAKLSGLSGAARRAGSASQTAIRHTGAYQDATRQANIKRNARHVGRLTTKDANGNQVPKEGLSARRQRLLARYMNQQKSDEKEGMAEQTVLMNSLTNNGEDETTLFSEYDKAMDSGDHSRARAIADIAGRRKDTAARFMAHNEEYEAGAKKRIATITDPKKQAEAQTKFNAGQSQIYKQIATGDNSKNFRAADGVKFEYASQFNKNGGIKRKSDGSPETDSNGNTIRMDDFDTWRATPGNVDTAIEHNITNINDLYGQQNKALEQLITDAGEPGRLSPKSRAQLQRILEARKNPNFSSPDNTKDANIARLEEALAKSEKGGEPESIPFGEPGGETGE